MALSIKNAQQIKCSGVNSVKTSFDCEEPYNLSCTIYNAALYRSLNKQFYQSKLKVICK